MQKELSPSCGGDMKGWNADKERLDANCESVKLNLSETGSEELLTVKQEKNHPLVPPATVRRDEAKRS